MLIAFGRAKTRVSFAPDHAGGSFGEGAIVVFDGTCLYLPREMGEF